EQSLEKLAKGLYNFYIDDNVPRVHNISFIINKILEKLNVKLEESSFKLFDKLSAYYLQGRYPSFKEKISQLIDKKEAKDILQKTKEVFQWMKSLKKSIK
ncbi:MAG: HEPN domain-containing protein, partial [Spirochaetes bacterium]|nr:HEPN domain-containing protein [Spirochaetota bacterium]